MCHLISFTGIYCPPAVSINVYFLPACCQAAFLELLCVYISPTLLFSSLFVAPSPNTKSNLQMSGSYPQRAPKSLNAGFSTHLFKQIWFSLTWHTNNTQVHTEINVQKKIFTLFPQPGYSSKHDCHQHYVVLSLSFLKESWAGSIPKINNHSTTYSHNIYLFNTLKHQHDMLRILKEIQNTKQ